MPCSATLLRVLALAVGVVSLGCATARNRQTSSVPVGRTSTPASVGRAPASTPAVRAPAPQPPPIRETLDVVYGKADGEELKLDLYTPTHLSGPLPAVVLLHGGGWYSGCKADCRDLARSFADHGYVAASVGYRLAPGHRFPAQLEDAKCAVRWLRANAPYYHVDTEAIGAVGLSAGAHLALLLGLTGAAAGFEGDGGQAGQSSQVQAVVNVMGPTDLARPGWPAAVDKMLVDLLGGGRDKLAVSYRAASPLTYVGRGAPPVLTIHGTADLLVPYEQAQILHAALRNAGVDSWLEPVRNKGHFIDWTPEDWQRGTALMLAFADKHLKRQ